MLRRQEMIGWLTVVLLFAGPMALAGATPERQGRKPLAAHLEVQPIRVDWLLQEDREQWVLTVAGPGDLYFRQESKAGQPLSLSLLDSKGNRLPDGIYAYELRSIPRPGREAVVQSGYLSVREGSFVDQSFTRDEPARRVKPAPDPAPRGGAKGLTTQSMCIGTACVAGDDSVPVLKLKDSFVRLTFEDSPDCCSYSRNWALQANDAIGGSDRFFVWDLDAVTTPFSIEGAAPGDSLYVRSNGNIGLGTSTPAVRLDVKVSSGGAATQRLQNSNSTGYSGIEYLDNSGNVDLYFGIDNAASTTRLNSVNSNPIVILTNSTERIRFPAPGGNVITAANGAFLSAGGAWTNASSRDSKRDIVEISGPDALKALQELNPVTFRYKEEPDEQYAGFIAEDVPDLVATNDRKHMSSMDVVAVLTKVVQAQQKTIDELSARLADLEGKKEK